MLEKQDWLTVSEVAKRLRLSTMRVQQFIRTGRLAATKFGHVWAIDKKTVEQFASLPRKPGRPWPSDN